MTFTVDTLGFGLLAAVVAWYVLRRPVLHIYANGRQVGRMGGLRRWAYGGLWAVLAGLCLVRLDVAVAGMLALALLFPFVLERD